MHQLLEAATAITHVSEGEATMSEEEEGERTRTLSEQELSLPRLKDAAFLSTPRVRNIQPDKYEPVGRTNIHLLAQPPDNDDAGTLRTSLEQPRTCTDDEIDNGIASNEHRETVGSPSEPPQASEEIPGQKSLGNPAQATDVKYDILLGTTKPSPQYGILGKVSGRKVALDLNETHTISLFGVQGGGKSYTLGTIAEMASLVIPHINVLPRPLATIIFHYSPTQDYKPEFTSMMAPNDDVGQLQVLRQNYDAEPQALRDLVLFRAAGQVGCTSCRVSRHRDPPFKVCGG